MSWHVDQEVLDCYREGLVGRVAAASVEAHLSACGECRGLLSTDSDWLDRSWEGIAERVEPGAPTPVELALAWVGVPSHVARVMAVTPSLRPSWLIAVAVTLLFAGLASRLAQPGGFDLFLVLAPLVPVAGVAVAYGRVGDPAHEMTSVMPMDPLRLLLLRVAAVTGFAAVVCLVVDIVIRSSGVTGLWILPSFALTLATLALGTRVSMWVAASCSSLAWVGLLAVFTTRNEGTLASVFDGDAQFLFFAAAAVSAWLLVGRRDQYRRGESQ